MSAPEARSLEIRTHDGLRLVGYELPPSGPTRAAVVLVHGMGDHARSRHYVRIGSRLAEGENHVFVFDLRGHGASDGPRVFVNRWDRYRADIGAMIETARPAAPGQPVFLVGLSMGALIVADWALHAPAGLRGVVVASAPLGATGASPATVALLRLLGAIAPRWALDPRLDRANISRDEAARRVFLEDPLVTMKVTPRLAIELLATAANLCAKAPEFRTPLLLLHGGQDKIADPQGSRDFHAAAGSNDKTLRLYPEARHNLFLEPEHPQVATDIAAWIATRRANG